MSFDIREPRAADLEQKSTKEIKNIFNMFDKVTIYELTIYQHKFIITNVRQASIIRFNTMF